jgi:type I restriction enzyme M protein
MAIKKSELYSSIWTACDALRGGMDASQYKDYVLFMLFIKYISDKYAGEKYPLVEIPPGATFADMVALKGKPGIGDHINKHIIEKLAAANSFSDLPDFNDPAKLGEGKEQVERITNLIAIFENPALDFSRNQAEHDDILGDAYEYLMRHFAQESGKSKGQFYTPSEVSRVIARLIGISPGNTIAATTAYDPTCGSGSLLLKVAFEAGKHIALYGQEKDATTAGLARMNVILHAFPTAIIAQGNTLTNPKFTNGDALKRYDYVVANPPFSDKAWRTGLPADLRDDPFQRFSWGEPPARQGDYAYLLHIISSMNGTGKAACILPHGILFRGNAEAAIRANLIKSGILKGIVGLPANLFYGTGIPACILVLDKENAAARKGVFMIDASKGFVKDGNKNRLREQDIHKITDTFANRTELARYSRMVPHSEILASKNDGNLNLPRYIDTADPEDIQDITAHLRGGIPARDIDALAPYWEIFPGLCATLFKKTARAGYCELRLPAAGLKRAIHDHPEFTRFTAGINKRFNRWKNDTAARLKNTFSKGARPKPFLDTLAENLLGAFKTAPLLDPYDIYQRFMDYRAATMQDDLHLIAADGWTAKTERILETKKARDGKTGKTVDKGWKCDLVPKDLIIARYFAKEQKALDDLNAKLETATSRLTELEEEHAGDEGLLFEAQDEKGALTKASVKTRLSEALEGGVDVAEPGETPLLKQWLELADETARLRKQIREAGDALDTLAYKKYPGLAADEVKTLVVDDKWMPALTQSVQTELDRVSQTLTARIRHLAERYAKPLPEITAEVETLSARVDAHLKKMGVAWK